MSVMEGDGHGLKGLLYGMVAGRNEPSPGRRLSLSQPVGIPPGRMVAGRIRSPRLTGRFQAAGSIAPRKKPGTDRASSFYFPGKEGASRMSMEQSRAKNTTSRYTARVSMLGLK